MPNYGSEAAPVSSYALRHPAKQDSIHDFLRLLASKVEPVERGYHIFGNCTPLTGTNDGTYIDVAVHEEGVVSSGTKKHYEEIGLVEIREPEELRVREVARYIVSKTPKGLVMEGDRHLIVGGPVESLNYTESRFQVGFGLQTSHESHVIVRDFPEVGPMRFPIVSEFELNGLHRELQPLTPLPSFD